MASWNLLLSMGPWAIWAVNKRTQSQACAYIFRSNTGNRANSSGHRQEHFPVTSEFGPRWDTGFWLPWISSVRQILVQICLWFLLDLCFPLYTIGHFLIHLTEKRVDHTICNGKALRKGKKLYIQRVKSSSCTNLQRMDLPQVGVQSKKRKIMLQDMEPYRSWGWCHKAIFAPAGLHRQQDLVELQHGGLMGFMLAPSLSLFPSNGAKVFEAHNCSVN